MYLQLTAVITVTAVFPVNPVMAVSRPVTAVSPLMAVSLGTPVMPWHCLLTAGLHDSSDSSVSGTPVRLSPNSSDSNNIAVPVTRK